MLLNVANPIAYIIERSLVCDVVRQDNAHGSTIVGRGYRAESLLARRVLELRGKYTQICSLIRLPSSSIVLILKSMPMVVIKDGVKESSEKRKRRQDFPTPESPISSLSVTLNSSYSLIR